MYHQFLLLSGPEQISLLWHAFLDRTKSSVSKAFLPLTVALKISFSTYTIYFFSFSCYGVTVVFFTLFSKCLRVTVKPFLNNLGLLWWNSSIWIDFTNIHLLVFGTLCKNCVTCTSLLLAPLWLGQTIEVSKCQIVLLCVQLSYVKWMWDEDGNEG